MPIPFSFEDNLLSIINPGEKHLLAVILLDTTDGNIPLIRDALIKLKEALEEDPMAQGKMEISIVSSADNGSVITDFLPAPYFYVPTLQISKEYNLSHAADLALEQLQERKILYRTQGVDCYTPILYFLSDGKNTALDMHIQNHVRSKIDKRQLQYVPISLISSPSLEGFRLFQPTIHEIAQIRPNTKESFYSSFVFLSADVLLSDIMADNDTPLPLPKDIIQTWDTESESDSHVLTSQPETTNDLEKIQMYIKSFEQLLQKSCTYTFTEAKNHTAFYTFSSTLSEQKTIDMTVSFSPNGKVKITSDLYWIVPENIFHSLDNSQYCFLKLIYEAREGATFYLATEYTLSLYGPYENMANYIYYSITQFNEELAVFSNALKNYEFSSSHVKLPPFPLIITLGI